MRDETWTTTAVRRLRRSAALAAASLLVATLVGACGSGQSGATMTGGVAMPTMAAAASSMAATAAATPAVTMHGPAAMTAAELATMWSSRPAFVRSNPRTEEAYEFALVHGDVIQYMPCYCGCAAMGHESNLDCYLKRERASYEEHASYCGICVDITLTAKRLVSEGRSLRDIRTAVDTQFGAGGTPGTPTELPPA